MKKMARVLAIIFLLVPMVFGAMFLSTNLTHNATQTTQNGGGGANLLDSPKTGDNSDFDDIKNDDDLPSESDNDCDLTWETPTYKTYDDYFVDLDISAETIDEKDLSGSGTAIDPYVVRSTKGFLWLTNGELSRINLISKNVILACDIILNDESFDENGVPSGGDGVVYSWENIKKCKSLCFDGNNFSISGLYINTTGKVIASMMGEESAPLQEVKNLKMKNVFLKSSYRVAPICYATYVLKNCAVENGYVYAGDYSAGIALFSNTVSNCVNKANVYTSSAQGTGGIVSKNYVYDDCVISNCINYGDIYTLSSESGFPARMGGIIGKPMGKTRVENCKNFGDIISDDQQIGGIVGIAWAVDIIIQDCDNYGIIAGNFNIGGILGNTYTNSSCYISGCNNYGQVKAENWSVGLIFGSAAYAEENTISIIDCCCDSLNLVNL